MGVIPIVNENVNMKKVLIEMTKKSFGHVGVKNKKNYLIGIIKKKKVLSVL